MISKLYTPEYVTMKRPMTTREAAIFAAQIPPRTPHREIANSLSFRRLQSALQKACLIYEDENRSDEYRLLHGIPSAWDGGIRVIEQAQVKRWMERRYTRTRQPRYLYPGGNGRG